MRCLLLDEAEEEDEEEDEDEEEVEEEEGRGRGADGWGRDGFSSSLSPLSLSLYIPSKFILLVSKVLQLEIKQCNPSQMSNSNTVRCGSTMIESGQRQDRIGQDRTDKQETK